VASVFMKVLELRPRDYDRGLRWLTAGRMERLRLRLAEEWVESGDRVLDVGCGTGAQALLCARQGARVTGVDSSSAMLEEAHVRAIVQGLSDKVDFLRLDALELAEHFQPGSFDVIVLSLVLSELDERSQKRLLAACQTLISNGGRLVILEEVVPEGRLARLGYTVQRWFWVAVSAFLTGSTTYPMRRPQRLLADAGFRTLPLVFYGDGLCMLLGQKAPLQPRAEESASDVPELRHRTTPRSLLRDLACLVTRIWPPYLKVRPGLYRIGRPGRSAPVLVTGNFDLTVRRVVKAMRSMSGYLLVADSRGINVWCAAGGGHFTAQSVITAVKRSGLEALVAHRRLILPQLCATGVDGRKIEDATGWRVMWGPVRATDLPAYLARGNRKTESMRGVAFPLLDRLEMSLVMWWFMAPLLAVIMFIVWANATVPAVVSLLALFLVTGVLWPWLPGHQGTTKGLALAAGSVVLTATLSLLALHLPSEQLFNWCIGLSALALFVGADFQGADARRRGGEVEQFPKMVPMELALGAAYLVVPRLMGW